jgi:hypothetical protein
MRRPQGGYSSGHLSFRAKSRLQRSGRSPRAQAFNLAMKTRASAADVSTLFEMMVCSNRLVFEVPFAL